MAIWGSIHIKKTCFFLILFFTLAVFTADIIDLREDIHILPCSHSSIDNNITTGIQSLFSFVPVLIHKFCSVNQKSSIVISLFHLFPYGYRAPPLWS
jgi:hypothetical protein